MGIYSVKPLPRGGLIFYIASNHTLNPRKPKKNEKNQLQHSHRHASVTILQFTKAAGSLPSVFQNVEIVVLVQKGR